MVVTPMILAGANVATDPGLVLLLVPFVVYEREGVFILNTGVLVETATVVVAVNFALFSFGLFEKICHAPPITTMATIITPISALLFLKNMLSTFITLPCLSILFPYIPHVFEQLDHISLTEFSAPLSFYSYG